MKANKFEDLLEQFIIFTAVIIAGFFIIYFFLKKKIKESVDPASLLDSIREEVNKIIIELNQTTDRNISLIEDRISNLADLLSRADKKISLLQRESEKHEVSNKVYSSLIKRPEEHKPNKTEQVIKLHQAGFSSSLIAKKIGMPRGEIDLIISLAERM